MGQQGRNVGGAGIVVHGEDRQQHQHRAGERIEEELEGRVDAPPAAPDADDEEHRNQHALEEDIEDHQVERAEHADHQRLEHEEGDNRSEEHTSELQSLMRNSYAGFCLKKKKKNKPTQLTTIAQPTNSANKLLKPPIKLTSKQQLNTE